ncbi:MAG: TlpA family protein disulfide reductase [Cryomorphaceae bacterium]|nr:MAG: TlpA family protein disulfide reductase [Cryomorphaceae bacterium]
MSASLFRMRLKSMEIFRRGLILLLFFSALPLFASQVHIRGEAPDYVNTQVLFYATEDGLSQLQRVIHVAESDAQGRFEATFPWDETGEIDIYIRHIRGTMIVQPNRRYEVFFPPLHKEQVRSFGGNTHVDLVFLNLPDNDPNALISQLHVAVDSFLVANVALVGSRAFKPKFESFETSMQQRFNHVDAYTATELHYILASTAFQTQVYTRRDLFDKYLKSSSFEPHPMFFAFLGSFFQKYFARFGANHGPDLIPKALASRDPGPALLELIQKDEFLERDVLREMVAVQALIEAYYLQADGRNVLRVLEHLGENASTEYLQKASHNVITALTRASKGFPAPELKFYDQHNEQVSLEDFRGKYVYLEFFATWCSDCPKDQSLLPALIAEYSEVVEVVSVVVDSPREAFQRHLSKYPQLKWPVLFDDTGFESRDRFGLRALPAYFLIDPEGNFYRSPAKSPSAGIAEDLYPILQRAKESRRIGVGSK